MQQSQKKNKDKQTCYLQCCKFEELHTHTHLFSIYAHDLWDCREFTSANLLIYLSVYGPRAAHGLHRHYSASSEWQKLQAWAWRFFLSSILSFLSRGDELFCSISVSFIFFLITNQWLHLRNSSKIQLHKFSMQ